MDAALLTIGEEILIGQIVDTNSAWMASELNRIGVRVRQIVSISDTSEEIKSTINQLLKNFDIVLATGGLGPTSDDITKQTLCELFGAKLVSHINTLEHIRAIFATRGLPLTDLNAKQAEVPNNCEVLFNRLGTAPGMWFNVNSKILVSMPGVPFEMKAIMEEHILPRLSALSGTDSIVHRTVHTFGVPESFLAQKLADWEGSLPTDIKLAYLPSPISIRLRLSSSGNNKELIEQKIEEQIGKLNQIIPETVFGYDTDSMASVVANLLIERGATLSLAESCTGGTIAHLITQLPGSSAYFTGGVVAYSNEVKITQLGVNPDVISNYGAVSRPVVEAMANGVRTRFKTEYAIATSGIAGPSGATHGKPVGTVWISVASSVATVSQQFNLGGDRERVILRSSVSALNMLRLLILSEKKNAGNG